MLKGNSRKRIAFYTKKQIRQKKSLLKRKGQIIQRVKLFDFNEYREKIKQLLISKAQGSINNEAHFRVNEIVPFAHFNSDYANKFAKWLNDQGWVGTVTIMGTDFFICELNEDFFKAELNKLLFQTEMGENDNEKT